MTGTRWNGVWAASLLDELQRGGVETVCLAPGSRSTPLVLAAAATEGLRLVTHLDERSAAFFALGLGKATGRPAVVVTTSGTAAANLLPAVVEASQSGVPLLLLTADRPNRLRDADANQAIDQVNLFGPYPRRFFEIAAPSNEPSSIRHLRSVAARAVADAMGADPGPVHLNIPFEKPLQPAGPERLEGPTGGREDGGPWVKVEQSAGGPGDEQLGELVSLLAPAERPVIVAGYVGEPDLTGPAVLRLAAGAGIPILTDPLSGARYGPGQGATRIATYAQFLEGEEVATVLAPDLVLRFGAAPTSSALARYLEQSPAAIHAVVGRGRRWKDHAAVATHYFSGCERAWAEALAVRCAAFRKDAAWMDQWGRVERAAVAAARPVDDPLSEPRVMTEALAAAEGAAVLFVSNSMPVRDLDGFGAARETEVTVAGNRGASGIDGIVSTAAGLSLGSGTVVCVLGDLAFYHDMNGLLATRESGVSVVYVVVHNDGGGIFHMLPIRSFEPAFTSHFATPHGLDFRHTAALYDLPYQRVATAAELTAALQKGVAESGSRVVEIRTDREDNRKYRDETTRAVVDAAMSALGQEP